MERKCGNCVHWGNFSGSVHSKSYRRCKAFADAIFTGPDWGSECSGFVSREYKRYLEENLDLILERLK